MVVGPDSILTQHSGVYFREMLGLGDLERLQEAFDRLDQDFCNLPAQHGSHGKTCSPHNAQCLSILMVEFIFCRVILGLHRTLTWSKCLSSTWQLHSKTLKGWRAPANTGLQKCLAPVRVQVRNPARTNTFTGYLPYVICVIFYLCHSGIFNIWWLVWIPCEG